MFAVIFGITLLPYATSLDYPYGLYFNAFTKYTPYVHQRVRISINTRSSRSTRTSNPALGILFRCVTYTTRDGKIDLRRVGKKFGKRFSRTCDIVYAYVRTIYFRPNTFIDYKHYRTRRATERRTVIGRRQDEFKTTIRRKR